MNRPLVTFGMMSVIRAQSTAKKLPPPIARTAMKAVATSGVGESVTPSRPTAAIAAAM